VRELIQEAVGDWTERQSTLQLQEVGGRDEKRARYEYSSVPICPFGLFARVHGLGGAEQHPKNLTYANRGQVIVRVNLRSPIASAPRFTIANGAGLRSISPIRRMVSAEQPGYR